VEGNISEALVSCICLWLPSLINLRFFGLPFNATVVSHKVDYCVICLWLCSVFFHEGVFHHSFICQNLVLFVLFLFQVFGAEAVWGGGGQRDLLQEENGHLQHQVTLDLVI
jgi:hypothetical protein